MPILSRLRPRRKPHLVGLDDHQRHALRALVLVGLADHDDEVGQLAVGDEGLAAVDAVAVAFLERRGARPAGRSRCRASVMAMAPISSPVARRGSQRFFCSSVPWCRM